MSEFNTSTNHTTEESKVPTPTIIDVSTATKVEEPKISNPEDKNEQQPKQVLDFLSSSETQKMLRGITFWIKFSSIMMYIGAGFTVISGLSFWFTIIVPLIYIGLAGIQVYLGIILWEIGNNTKLIQDCNSTEDYKLTTMTILTKFHS
jgi:hypothetical protein